MLMKITIPRQTHLADGEKLLVQNFYARAEARVVVNEQHVEHVLVRAPLRDEVETLEELVHEMLCALVRTDVVKACVGAERRVPC